MKKLAITLSIITLLGLIGCNNQSSSSEDKPVILSDAKLYDVFASEQFAPFEMEEFNKTLTFNREENALYFGEKAIYGSDNQIIRVFVSDFDKDGYRELVYESGLDAKHAINVRDLKNNKVYYTQSEYEIGRVIGQGAAYYYHNLDVVNDKLIVNLTEPDVTDVEVFDRGTLEYKDNNGQPEFSFVWENLHQIKSLSISGCQTFSGSEKVEHVLENGKEVFYLHKEASYIFDVKLEKLENATDKTYPTSKETVCFVKNLDENGFDFVGYLDSENNYQDGIHQIYFGTKSMPEGKEYASITFFYLEFFYTLNAKFVD